MEDLIVIIIFIVASLASFISKQREQRRQRKLEAEGKQDQEFDWKDIVLKPEVKPVEEHSDLPTKPWQPQTITGVPSERKEASSYSASTKELSTFALPEAGAFTPDILTEKRLKDLTAEIQVTQSLPPIVKLDNFLGVSNYREFATTPGSRKKHGLQIKMKSKKLLQGAILAREILDRPRAYDI